MVMTRTEELKILMRDVVNTAKMRTITVSDGHWAYRTTALLVESLEQLKEYMEEYEKLNPDM